MYFFHRNWKPGDLIPLRGPFGNIHSEPLSNYSSLLLICQGTGIVPFISLLHSLLSNEESEQIIHLIFCVKSCDQMLLSQTLYEFCNYWNFKLKIYISSPVGNNFRLFGPNKTFVNKKLGHKELEDAIESNRKYILCGSKEFMSCIRDYLLHFNVGKSDILRL